MNTAISWFFLLYFIILFGERIQSIIRTFKSNVSFFENGFNTYTYILTFISLIGTVLLLVLFNDTFWKSLFDNSINVNYSILIITSGVILLSGMVHTEYTIAPIQFVSYGMLIIAMILRTYTVSISLDNSFTLWYSLIYLILFSMAIPVMYHSNIEYSKLFHIIEAITSFVLVIFFTYMLRNVFIGVASDLLYWVPIVVATLLDAIVIGMRWRESVNTFALIFIIASIFIFMIGKIIFPLIKK